MDNKYNEYGVHMTEILLPATDLDLTKWSVVACDQFTSQPDYWQKVSEEVGEHPSTLKMIYPEIYLNEDNKEQRIENINKAMSEYLKKGILVPHKPGFILVDRSTPHTPSRKGLIVALDLELYDYSAGSQSLIRATEGTVLDRIPPRVKIRQNASIESPHIMVLIDDPDKTLIEPLFNRTDEYCKLYDFELMQGGGHIKGYKVDDEESQAMIFSALDNLYKNAVSSSSAMHNGNSSVSPLLFAVGDGNHSLATAKAHWENIKSSLGCSIDSSLPEHPARYALVELVNLHDDGLVFEPIHRVLFGISSKDILKNMADCCSQLNLDYSFYTSRESMCKALEMSEIQNAHLLPFILEGNYGIITVHNPTSNLEVGTLQTVIDTLIERNPSIEVDYIHGDEVVTNLGTEKNSMGFYLPVMNKHMLFRTVMIDGVLPRKTFSMGEAEEKRYYLECRIIVK